MRKNTIIKSILSSLVVTPLAILPIVSCAKDDSNYLKVTFDAGEGKIALGEAVVKVAKDTKTTFGSIVKPTVVAQDKIFVGWTLNDKSFSDKEIISSNITVKANYVSSTSGFYKTLTFKTLPGVTITGNNVVAVKNGHPFFTVNRPIATKANSLFRYWATEQAGVYTQLPESRPITQSLDLYPVFVDVPSLHNSIYSVTDETGQIIIWDIDTLCQTNGTVTGYDFRTGESISVDKTLFDYGLTIGKNITTIPANFLYGCRMLNHPLTIPATVTSIGDHFMFNCNSFTSNLYVECLATAFIGGNEQVCADSPTWTDSQGTSHDSTIYTIGFNALGSRGTDFITKFPSQGTTGVYRRIINQETHSHALTISSILTNVTASVSPSTIDYANPFTITFDSSRTIDLTDASLIATANGNSIVMPLKNTITPGETTIQYTVKIIDSLFQKAGFSKLGENDSISFKLARPNTYEVQNDTTLYKIGADGLTKTKLTDSEIEEIADNAFLVKNSYNEYTIHTDDFTDFFITLPNGSTNDIYLIKGTFYTGPGKTFVDTITVNLHGILDSNNNKLATLQSYHNESLGFMDLRSYKFSLENLNVKGRTGQDYDFPQCGMHCIEFICDNCDFTGTTTLWQYGKFTNCTFDSSTAESYFVEGETYKTNYPIACYGTQVESEFDTCTFKSGGKAIKIYSADPLDPKEELYQRTHKIINCTFTLDVSKCPGTPAEHKCPIEIDARYLENETINSQWIIIHSGNTISTGYPGGQELLNLVDTTEQHPHIIVNPE